MARRWPGDYELEYGIDDELETALEHEESFLARFASAPPGQGFFVLGA